MEKGENVLKLMHLADLHLDSPFKGVGKTLQNRQQALIDAPFKALERGISIAINQEVDAVVIVGDLYDAEQQTIYAQHFLAKQLQRLQQANIPVIFSYGNHDYLKLTDRPIEFGESIHVLNRAEVDYVDLVLKTGESARFYGFSYTKRWVNERMIDEYPVNPRETTYTIGLLHGQEQGNHYAPFDVPSLLSKHYDYWALGHIHQARVLHEVPLIQYSGCIQGRHRLETGDKGAYIVTLQPNQPAQSQFVSLAQIVWQEVVVECHPEMDQLKLVQFIEQAIQAYREEAQVNRQSYLLVVTLKNSDVLKRTVQQQIEEGELLAALSNDESNEWFVVVTTIHQIRGRKFEPFQYDRSLKESFALAKESALSGVLYSEVMEDIWHHAIVKSWLKDVMTDSDLQKSIIEQAEQLVAQAAGFDEEVPHEH